MIINWQQFGLKKDPYDTQPLVEGSDLSIEQAFIGRDKERAYIDNLMESSERICLAICGNVGVGKTSLTNIEKFIWKYRRTKLLFSFRREIEACDELLNKKNFLIEIIGSVLREIKLLQPELLKDEALVELDRLVDITQSIAFSAGAQAFGFGINAGKDSSVYFPQQLSTTLLEQHFNELINFIKENEINGHSYSGLVVHVNNFDVVMSTVEGKKKTITFFNEIRDILQISGVYYIFLGPNNFFSEIISINQRVKSIFVQTPLKVCPLGKTEIVKALEERMKLLKSDDVADYIKPIEDDVVFRLYDLHAGDIRSIMSSIRDILSQCSENLVKPLSMNEAMLLLGKERWDKIEKAMTLTQEQKEILKYLAGSKKFISQKEIVQLFNKKQSNVSSYYFKPLRENNIIEEKERNGTTIYFGLTNEYTPLQWLVESQKNIKKIAENKLSQLNFDFSKEKNGTT